MHSIELPTVPRREDATRGILYHSGFVFSETDTPGVLEAVYLLEVDFTELVEVELTKNMLKQRLLSLRRLADHCAKPKAFRWISSLTKSLKAKRTR